MPAQTAQRRSCDYSAYTKSSKGAQKHPLSVFFYHAGAGAYGTMGFYFLIKTQTWQPPLFILHDAIWIPLSQRVNKFLTAASGLAVRYNTLSQVLWRNNRMILPAWCDHRVWNESKSTTVNYARRLASIANALEGEIGAATTSAAPFCRVSRACVVM